MRSICLTLPTNRHCPDTITALGAEAAYAADHFDIDVHLLVLDSCPAEDRAAHADALRHLPDHPGSPSTTSTRPPSATSSPG